MVSVYSVSITNLCGINMNSNVMVIDDLEIFDAWNEKKQKEPVSFPTDPVALACAAYRMQSYMDLTEIMPLQEDYDLAARVRRHFMDKLVIQRLTGNGKISAFREKLGAFLVDNRPIYKDEIGMLYHLPYFYFEDLAQEELLSKIAEVAVEQPHQRGVHLTPLSKLVLKRRGGEVRQYWWVDSEKRPYCLSVGKNTDNQPLYQSIWEFPAIDVVSHMYVKKFPGADRHYYRLVGAKLLGVGSQ